MKEFYTLNCKVFCVLNQLLRHFYRFFKQKLKEIIKSSSVLMFKRFNESTKSKIEDETDNEPVTQSLTDSQQSQDFNI